MATLIDIINDLRGAASDLSDKNGRLLAAALDIIRMIEGAKGERTWNNPDALHGLLDMIERRIEGVTRDHNDPDAQK